LCQACPGLFKLTLRLFDRSLRLALIQMEHGLALLNERSFAVEFVQQESIYLGPNVSIDVAGHRSDPLLIHGHILP
jgi:hypothetical protein